MMKNKIFVLFPFLVLVLLSLDKSAESAKHKGIFVHLLSTAQDIHRLSDVMIKATIKNYGPESQSVNVFVLSNPIPVFRSKHQMEGFFALSPLRCRQQISLEEQEY